MATEKTQPTGEEERSTAASRKRPRAENAIRLAEAPKRRGAQAPAGRERPSVRGVAESGAEPLAPRARDKPARDASAIPQVVREQLVQVGKDYFFADGARAFTDRGTKLTTPSENSALVKSLVAIAQARGWQRVVVSGSERFRKQAWAAAREAGLEVKGYRASDFDEARLVRRLARRTDEPTQPHVKQARTGQEEVLGVRESRAASPRQHSGRLIEHGAAPYQYDPRAPLSYFARIETSRGEQELWGVDLERAFRESLSRPQLGDEVVLRAVKREPVTVRTRQQKPGEAADGKALTTHRNRWIVEKKEFLERRGEAAQVLRDPSVAPAQGSRSHPELLGAYLQMHAAELAARQFRDPQDRDRFVALVRTALADSVARGEALPAVRMRHTEVPRRMEEASARRMDRARDERNR